jgi:glycine betaine catabolism B
MTKKIYQDFDGYDQLIADREFTRKHAHDFTPDNDIPDPYIERLHPGRLLLRIMEMTELTPSTTLFRLSAVHGHLPPFQAGQYISLHLTVGKIRTNRPYSLCSHPGQTGYYDIAVKRVPHGLVSNFLLDETNVGDVLDASGPAGLFYHNPLFHDSDRVMIAGGSGITPFFSMIQEMITKQADGAAHLFYGNRSVEEAIFHREFSDISNKHKQIRYYPVIENPPAGFNGWPGVISGDLLKNILGDMAGFTFYLCGPQGMYDYCLPQLESLNVPRRKIRRESYGAPLNVFDSPGWPARVSSEHRFVVKTVDGREFEIAGGDNLLAALEKNGHIVPAECRSGECSRCRVRIISGDVFQPTGALVRRSDRKLGYVHACVSYPLSDLEIAL